MAPEEALQGVVDLLTLLNVIEFWSIGIQNKDVRLLSLVIKGQIYGDLDQVMYDYLIKKKAK